MINFFNFFTFFICLIPTVLCLHSLFKVGIKPLTLIQVCFFSIYIFPLFLDIIFTTPSYYNFPGFNAFQGNFLVVIIYNVFVTFVSYFNYFFRGKNIIDINIKNNLNKIDVLLFFVSLFPIFLFAFSPDKSVYAVYGGNALRDYNEVVGGFHGYINISTFLSVIILAYLIVKNYNKNYIFVIFLFLLALFDFWVNGKRTIVLIFLFFLSLFSILQARTFKSFIFVIFLSILFGVYSSWYQATVRDFGDKVTFEENYENVRIDFFRDQRLKMAIYAEINPHLIKILPNRGDSFLFSATFFIPRDFWENKPYPYAQYFTSAMFYEEPKLWGWGMTTSIYDEIVANIGLLGLLIIQFLVFIFFKLVMKVDSNNFRVFSIFLFLILMMVQMIAFMFAYIIWFLWLLKLKMNQRVV